MLNFDTITERLEQIRGLKPGPARGTALETVGGELFSSIDGVSVALTNVRARDRDGELDILLRNDTRDGGGLLGLPSRFVLECKASVEPVATRDVAHFLYQLQLRQIRYGIMLAAAGITGTAESATSAHRVVRDARGWGYTILVIDYDEVALLRSPAHLVAVIDRKDELTVGTLGAPALNARAMQDLDPSPRSSRGFKTIEDGLRMMRTQALGELLDEARALELLTAEKGASRARHRLERLKQEVDDQRHHDIDDPFWSAVRAALVAFGGASLRLHDEIGADAEGARLIAFDVLERAPQRLGALPGDPLWSLLLQHWASELGPDATDRRRSASAIAALCVESILVIDDIDDFDGEDDLPSSRAGSLDDIEEVARLGEAAIGSYFASAELLRIALGRDPGMLHVVEAPDGTIRGFTLVTALTGAGEDGLRGGRWRVDAALDPEWVVPPAEGGCLYVGMVLGTDGRTRTVAKHAMRRAVLDGFAANDRLARVYARAITDAGRELATRMGLRPVVGVSGLVSGTRDDLLRRLGAADGASASEPPT